MLNVVTWTVDPILLDLGGPSVGWYGLFFALGLVVVGPSIVDKIWQKEKLPEKWFTSLFYYVLIGAVVGARLGHCLFYEPEYFLANPVEILKIWQGGLASHGGVLGIVIAIYFHSKRYTHKSMLWTFDRVCVPVGFAAGMIRLGNLMNHEIYGHATDLPWGFRFIENVRAWSAGLAEPIFSVPSHPTQIYEALCYFAIFGITMWMYWKKEAYKHTGLIFGVSMILIFTARFFIEFLKNDQVAFEADMSLNMGQWLSIPFILLGIWSVWYSFNAKTPVDKQLI